MSEEQSQLENIYEFGRRLKMFEERYNSDAKKNEECKSNAIAAKKISQILFQNSRIEKSQVEEIKSLILWTENQSHWNGSSWMDYKLHVRSFLRYNGFEVEIAGI